MIWGNRCSAIASLSASINTTSLLDVKHRFHGYRLEGVIDESLLVRPIFPAASLEVRPAIAVPLHGRVLVRLGGERRWIEPGEGYVMRPGSHPGWRIEAGCRGLTFAWDGALADPPSETFFRLTASQCRALEHAAELAYAPANLAEASNVHSACIDALRATELLPAATFERTEVDPACQALSLAIDARLSHLAEEPMQVELQEELGISERHLRRLTAEVFKRYGFVDTNWGEARVRRRLMAAVAFMSHPDATVSLVAREVGYHSTQAMARAFSRAGFPPPGRIRDVLAELATK